MLAETKNVEKNLSKLTVLKAVLKPPMIIRLAKNGITLDTIQQAYDDAPKESKEEEVIKLLRGEKEGKPQIIKTKAVLKILMNFLGQSILK